jgi:hypothetical protein
MTKSASVSVSAAPKRWVALSELPNVQKARWILTTVLGTNALSLTIADGIDPSSRNTIKTISGNYIVPDPQNQPSLPAGQESHFFGEIFQVDDPESRSTSTGGWVMPIVTMSMYAPGYYAVFSGRFEDNDVNRIKGSSVDMEGGVYQFELVKA